MEPTQVGFLAFIRTVMQISSTYLPDDSPYITYSYNYAVAITYDTLNLVAPGLYTFAVYNLGGDALLNWANDQPDQTFFSDIRKSLEINSFAAGVIASAADTGSSETLRVSKGFDNAMIGNLQEMKTPYGRAYLSIVQRAGPVWGLS